MAKWQEIFRESIKKIQAERKSNLCKPKSGFFLPDPPPSITREELESFCKEVATPEFQEWYNKTFKDNK